MKNSMLCILCLVNSVAYSQLGEPEITDRDWYLTEINIGGVNVEIPRNDGLIDVPLYFEDVSPNFSTTVCNTLEGDVERLINGLDEFGFPLGLAQTLIDCDIAANADFEMAYFNFFYDKNLFTFGLTIVDIPPDEVYLLRLIVPNGDYVIYSDSPRLSIEDQEKNNFFALPNPVNDQLVLKTPQIVAIAITIYDVLGQEVLKESTQTNREINMSGLKSGLYFVTITTADGGYKL